MPEVSPIPRHVAIIMDGNGRWARERGLPRLEGHRQGTENMRRVVSAFDKHGIKYLTLFAFSTENWNRPRSEVSGLFRLLANVIDRETEALHRREVRLRHVGRLDGLSTRLTKRVKRAVELTKDNTGMTLTVAFNYGGRTEILDAVRCLLSRGVTPVELDEELFHRCLYTPDLPDPDFIIRTGGEVRVSNFFLWQAAYSEYYFTPTYWPDFGEEEIEKALLAYSQRQRRFGRVPD
jgi:undecaprenyl diphosphate synthase